MSTHKPPPDGRYSGIDAAELAGVSYRRLHYWKCIGRLHPITDGDGIGFTDWYSTADIAKAIRVRLLTEAGIELAAAWDAVEKMTANETDTIDLTDSVTVTLAVK